MIVFLCEEMSITPILRTLMSHDFPDLIEGLDWQIITFQGKADLEKNFSHRMRNWTYNTPKFVILRDNDGGDCIRLKKRLSLRAQESEKPFSIRIVCQEIESWFIGDLEAVEKAYPQSNASSYVERSKFRNPDTLGNASEELTKLTSTHSKVGRALKISTHLNLDTNRSPSFNILRSKVKELVSS